MIVLTRNLKFPVGGVANGIPYQAEYDFIFPFSALPWTQPSLKHTFKSLEGRNSLGPEDTNPQKLRRINAKKFII